MKIVTKKILSIVLTIAIVLSINVTLPLEAKKITSKYMTVGESVYITKANWKSSNINIAKVILGKRIFARKGGKVTLTANIKGVKNQINVYVLSAKASAVTMSKGNTYQIKTNGVSYKKFKWTSKNKSIVSVSATGKVTAKKAGTTKVTGTYKKKTISVKFTVKNKSSKTVVITTPDDKTEKKEDTKKEDTKKDDTKKEDTKKDDKEKEDNPITPTTTETTPTTTETQNPSNPQYDESTYPYYVNPPKENKYQKVNYSNSYFEFAFLWGLNKDDPDVVEYAKHAIALYSTADEYGNFTGYTYDKSQADLTKTPEVITPGWKWLSNKEGAYMWVSESDYESKSVLSSVKSKTIDGITFDLSKWYSNIVLGKYDEYRHFIMNNDNDEIYIEITSDAPMDKSKIKIVINNDNITTYGSKRRVNHNVITYQDYGNNILGDTKSRDIYVPDYKNRLAFITDYNNISGNEDNKVWLRIYGGICKGNFPIQIYYNDQLLCESNVVVEYPAYKAETMENTYQQIKAGAIANSGEDLSHENVLKNMAVYINNNFLYSEGFSCYSCNYLQRYCIENNIECYEVHLKSDNVRYSPDSDMSRHNDPNGSWGKSDPAGHDLCYAKLKDGWWTLESEGRQPNGMLLEYNKDGRVDPVWLMDMSIFSAYQWLIMQASKLNVSYAEYLGITDTDKLKEFNEIKEKYGDNYLERYFYLYPEVKERLLKEKKQSTQ